MEQSERRVRRGLFPSVTAALVSIVTASVVVTAQDRFESSVDLVALDVCAVDRQGHPATLVPADLTVFDNGVRQQIVLFSPGERVPLAVTLLVDSSQSMHAGLLDRASAAAGALIQHLPPDALVEVISFNDRPAVRYPMGADHERAELALHDLSAGGATALYESVLVAIRDQERAGRGRTEGYREVIVLLTDGDNTAGHLDFDEVIDEARRSGILVYTALLSPRGGHSAGGPSWQMTQLGLDTGGETMAVRGGDDLTGIYEHIAADVRTLYRVGFVPSPLIRNGAWHQVQVRTSATDVVLRTRSGYYAAYP